MASAVVLYQTELSNIADNVNGVSDRNDTKVLELALWKARTNFEKKSKKGKKTYVILILKFFLFIKV